MAVKNVASNIQSSASNDQGAISGAPSTSNSTQQIRPRYALVANKIDQEHMRVIKSERHHKFAQVTRNYLQSESLQCLSDFISYLNLFIIARLFTGEWTFNICHVRKIGRRRQFMLSENSSRVTGH